MITKTKFAHVGLNCKDPAATERFYTKYFGFRRARVVSLGAGSQIVFITDGTSSFELFQAQGDSQDIVQKDGPTSPGFRHLAFAVPDVDAKIAEIGSDTTVTFGPLRFDDFLKGWAGAWITDPDGRIIEISQGYREQHNPPPLEAK